MRECTCGEAYGHRPHDKPKCDYCLYGSINVSISHDYPCECSDSACPAHPGVPACLVDCGGFTRLYRRDMQDREGTVFCNKGCSDDALASGLFVTAEEEKK